MVVLFLVLFWIRLLWVAVLLASGCDDYDAEYGIVPGSLAAIWLALADRLVLSQ